MSEGPARVKHHWLALGGPGLGYVEHEEEYVRADLYDEAIEALKKAREALSMIDGWQSLPFAKDWDALIAKANT